MAQETQYAILMYNFGITYSATRGVRSITTETKGLTGIHARLADISHGRALDHVAHCKALDRLVFGDAPRAVGAAHEADVATSLFVAPAVSSFLGLFARVSTVKRGSIHANVLPSILSNRLFLALDGSPARTQGCVTCQRRGLPCCRVRSVLTVVGRLLARHLPIHIDSAPSGVTSHARTKPALSSSITSVYKCPLSKHGLDLVLVSRVHALSSQFSLLLHSLEHLAQRKLAITCYSELVCAW